MHVAFVRRRRQGQPDHLAHPFRRHGRYLPGDRVLSRRRPSTPSATNRSCWRRTVVLAVPVAAMMPLVPATVGAQPARSDSARRAFGSVLRSATMASKPRRSASSEPIVLVPFRMRQLARGRRGRHPKRETSVSANPLKTGLSLTCGSPSVAVARCEGTLDFSFLGGSCATGSDHRRPQQPAEACLASAGSADASGSEVGTAEVMRRTELGKVSYWRWQERCACTSTRASMGCCEPRRGRRAHPEAGGREGGRGDPPDTGRPRRHRTAAGRTGPSGRWRRRRACRRRRCTSSGAKPVSMTAHRESAGFKLSNDPAFAEEGRERGQALRRPA